MANIQFEQEFEPQFTALVERFYQNFEQFGETGAAIAVYHRQRLVVNCYGSHQSKNGDWHQLDKVCTMSASKAPLAFCIHLLAEKGLLDLSAPVCQYWPAFAANGKDEITIKQVLNHTSGVAVVTKVKAGDIFHWEKMVRAIELAKPIHQPGQAIAYQALTYGHILGQLIRLVDGRSATQFFQQEVADPLAINYSLSHFPQGRTRQVDEGQSGERKLLWLYANVLAKLPFWKMKYFAPCGTDYSPNSEIWRCSEAPAVTGEGSAVGLAKFYALLVNKGTLDNKVICSEQTISTMVELSIEQREMAMGMNWRMGLGVMLNSHEMVSFGPNPKTFGHAGMGGSVGFADPDNELAFAYVTEKYHNPSRQDKTMAGVRLKNLVQALYE